MTSITEDDLQKLQVVLLVIEACAADTAVSSSIERSNSQLSLYKVESHRKEANESVIEIQAGAPAMEGVDWHRFWN